ncbi:MAG TPA: hypothetical protein VGO07_04580 [Candidatus Saccharimonadales bacterium]|jgi:hypothetical protein|nr:hypothetical protein [Candidatus Saccharimonadales bacterium]
MAQTKKKPAKKQPQTMDGVYLLKLALYVILGSMWVKITHGDNLNIPIPVGFILGLVFATHEHFQIDRKIEYAVLMVAMLVGYFAPYGLYINF